MARGYDNDNNRPVHHVVLEGRQAGSFGKRPEDNPYDRKSRSKKKRFMSNGLFWSSV
jgi:hypothetical protein